MLKFEDKTVANIMYWSLVSVSFITGVAAHIVYLDVMGVLK